MVIVKWIKTLKPLHYLNCDDNKSLHICCHKSVKNINRQNNKKRKNITGRNNLVETMLL